MTRTDQHHQMMQESVFQMKLRQRKADVQEQLGILARVRALPEDVFDDTQMRADPPAATLTKFAGQSIAATAAETESPAVCSSALLAAPLGPPACKGLGSHTGAAGGASSPAYSSPPHRRDVVAPERGSNPPGETSILRRGILTKRPSGHLFRTTSDTIGGYHRRYFVLTPYWLLYTKENCPSDRKPRGALAISNLWSASAFETDPCGDQPRFGIRVTFYDGNAPDGDQWKEWLLRTSTEANQQAWIQALTRAKATYKRR
eukprot:CAMPEP_0114545916 /NCGR_PEP_ID=MMETSP0114-20121206/3663_1 /TAXON_ID=31324 /ORGANISM="Goniomonas sp, Strain m" /LENGTH=259 /DNA_ID=CAMNT_0001730391 /DNA_START=15 /DNA_END=794 /DNA_ORIENTATION=+